MTTHSALSSWRTRIRVLAVALVALLLAAFLPGAGAQAKPGDKCDRRNNNTYRKLLECITAEGLLEHEQAFQDIADANGGTRASGTPGYDASADYVAGLLEDAGYIVNRQEFDFPFFSDNAPAELQILDPAGTIDLETGSFEYSGSGDVTGNIVPVDLALGLGNTSTSGCEAIDFDGLNFDGDNDIALIQRGFCPFADKALNAQMAGAEAVIIFNQGDADGRFDLIVGTLGDQSAGVIEIPVVGASYEDGVTLSETDFPVRVFTDTFSEVRSTENVIAESPGGDPDNVVMAGAHLDSVPEGPGINDNGSGSSAILEVALSLAKLDPVNKLRFAWWGAEESGLIGSTFYVDSLPDEERDDIAAYLNFDMVASPNFIYGVYDADATSFEPSAPVPVGSAAIEDLFEVYFTWQDIPYEDTEFSGRSDYQAFINNDIPSSGLFTGAEVAKTDEQQALWGGVAGAAYDPCYHQACDSLDPDYGDDAELAAVYAQLNALYDLVGNVNLEALGTNSDAIAFAVLTLAYSTETVNGVPGKDVPGSPSLMLPEPAGPAGTVGFGGTGGGDGAANGES
jgi:Zn-dependent M28 family amino/carboxypeptidase